MAPLIKVPRPSTFWGTLAAHEYDFEANVDPVAPHPRWSQASERMIDTGERRPTLKFNRYGGMVAGLYRPGARAMPPGARR